MPPAVAGYYAVLAVLFFVNAYPAKLLDVATTNFTGIDHMMLRVLGNILCDLEPKVK